jgi:hypothetical protein
MKIANSAIIYEMQEITMTQTCIKEALQILKSIRLNEGKVEAKDINMLESEIISIADALSFDRRSIKPV